MKALKAKDEYSGPKMRGLDQSSRWTDCGPTPASEPTVRALLVEAERETSLWKLLLARLQTVALDQRNGSFTGRLERNVFAGYLFD